MDYQSDVYKINRRLYVIRVVCVNLLQRRSARLSSTRLALAEGGSQPRANVLQKEGNQLTPVLIFWRVLLSLIENNFL